MLLRIFIVLSILSTSACNNSDRKDVKLDQNATMEETIAYLLQAKYDEEFTVKDVDFEIGLNSYEFSASPKSNPKITFTSTYNELNTIEEKQLGYDGFPNSKFSYQAGVYYKSLFPNKQLKHIAQVSVYSKYTHSYGEKVPEWDTYLKNRVAGSTIRMNTYFFEVPDHEYHQTVVTLFGVMETLQEKYKNDYSVYAGFWPSGFLEGKKFEALTFGFEATTEKDADDILMTFQYLAKEFFVKIVNGSLQDMDEKRVFELIKDFDKNGPTPMVEI